MRTDLVSRFRAVLTTRFRGVLISLFVILDLAVVFRMNLPPIVSRALERIDAGLPPGWGIRARMLGFRMHQLAHWTWLDPRWEMFSNVKGSDWRYRIEALLRDGARTRPTRMPLAGQSERTLAQDFLFDFKEGKMRLNTAADRQGREAYARFLCRKFRVLEGLPVESVRISIEYQDILEPKAARAQGRHYAPEVAVYPLTEARCA